MMPELQFKTYKLVPSTQSACLKFNFTGVLLAIYIYRYLFKNTQKVMLKSHFNFSNLVRRTSFFFWNWEISRNFHFHSPCHSSLSRKTKILGEWDRICSILLKSDYASLYFPYFVHGCWCFFRSFNLKFYPHQSLFFKN